MIQSLLHNASVFCCLVLFLAPVVNGAAVTSSEQAAASPSLCSVCGINQKVGSPDSIFEFPGQVGVSCGALETAGGQGEIPMAACPFLSAMITDTCSCYHIGDADEQHEELGQEDHIINENPIRTASCSVCGSEQRVSIPDGIVNFLGYPIWTCAVLESAGKEGLIPQGQCYFLPASIKQVCGCRRIQIGYTASYRELRDTLDNQASATMPIFTPTASLNLSPSTAPTSTIPMSQPIFYDGAEDDIEDDDETSDFQRGYMLYLIISMVGLTVTVCCLFLYGTIHQNDNANNSGNQRAGLSRRFPVGPSVGNQQEMIDNRFTSGDRQQDEQDPLEIAEDSKLRPLVLEVLFPEQKVSRHHIDILLFAGKKNLSCTLCSKNR